MKTLPHVLAVAPMMERTDRHCRYFLRLLAPNAWLYTEMVTARALRFGDRARLLAFSAAEHPIALQLGGADPAELAAAARFGADAGYDEVNLNVGCPSDRVQAGCFGAALMREPERVADCVAAMRAAAPIPITVKTRIGVDDADSYEFLSGFVAAVAAAGCRTVIVHARKAWLRGLSPKQNREIPPLDYPRVHRLKRDFPELEIVINGGFTTLEASAAQLGPVDGVMLGRAAYDDPWLLARLDARLFAGGAEPAALARTEAVHRLRPYLEREVASGTPLKAITRHLFGLLAGLPGARRWRRSLGTLPSGRAGITALAALVASFEGRAGLATMDAV